MLPSSSGTSFLLSICFFYYPDPLRLFKIIWYLSTLLFFVYVFLLSHMALSKGFLFGSCGWRLPLTLANVSLVSVVL